jgi:hypothetical protein
VEPEPSGDDEKLWLRDEQGASWLWKPVTAKDGRRQGEDWAELLVHVVAETMGVPTAPVRLARRAAMDGLVSRDVKPDGVVEAHHGSVLLQNVVDDYDRRGRDRRGHSIENIARVLDGVGPPVDERCAGLDGFGVFVGYLVLDALVAGQDRHSDNWSVIVMPDRSRRLMPSYDHATSLGFNLTDVRRGRTLAGGMDSWVRRGTANRFEHGRDVTLVAWAARAATRADLHVRQHWRAALDLLDIATVAAVADRIDVVSEVTRTFITEVLERNRGRLLDEF